MKTIVFIYDHAYPHLWKDGLWAALKELNDVFQIDRFNLSYPDQNQILKDEYDFVLGWGAWNSSVKHWVKASDLSDKKGLCIAGNAFKPQDEHDFDVLFYETEWYKPVIKHHQNIIHAFGVNTDIYHKITVELPKVFDYLTVGAFANWKRQLKLIDKPGVKMAIGEIQRENKQESFQIITKLLLNNVGVMDMVLPTELNKLYNLSKKVYIPANINGGGERAVLETRACGVKVEIEPDNPKLQELIQSEIYDHHYYAKQLEKGIKSICQ